MHTIYIFNTTLKKQNKFYNQATRNLIQINIFKIVGTTDLRFQLFICSTKSKVIAKNNNINKNEKFLETKNKSFRSMTDSVSKKVPPMLNKGYFL